MIRACERVCVSRIVSVKRNTRSSISTKEKEEVPCAIIYIGCVSEKRERVSAIGVNLSLALTSHVCAIVSLSHTALLNESTRNDTLGAITWHTLR
jgi:hypothetical protein